MIQQPPPPMTGTWLNPPPTIETAAGGFIATAARGSDFWRDTYYGFVRDSGHALLRDFSPGSAFEVTVHADACEQFDQAGILIRRDATTWTKAGIENADGAVGIGAVVTRGFSDWSSWQIERARAAEPIRFRASWSREALIIRARLAGDPWRLLRVAPMHGSRDVLVGPYLCAPARSGFRAAFFDSELGPADRELHS